LAVRRPFGAGNARRLSLTGGGAREGRRSWKPRGQNRRIAAASGASSSPGACCWDRRWPAGLIIFMRIVRRAPPNCGDVQVQPGAAGRPRLKKKKKKKKRAGGGRCLAHRPMASPGLLASASRYRRLAWSPVARDRRRHGFGGPEGVGTRFDGTATGSGPGCVRGQITPAPAGRTQRPAGGRHFGHQAMPGPGTERGRQAGGAAGDGLGVDATERISDRGPMALLRPAIFLGVWPQQEAQS